MIKHFFPFILLFNLSVAAQQTEQKFVQHTSYLLYLPDNYSNDTLHRWPLLLFLHGAGEVGTDIEKIKVHGPAKLVAEGKKFPFIVISPQSQIYEWRPDQLHDLLIDLKKKYRVDEERIYLTGLSMGGFGTWELALKYPKTFAAIAPICGGGDTSEIWKLRHMPVWCFHGAKDPIVSLSRSQRMMSELEKDNHTSKFTIYPEAEHDSWTETYKNDSLYSWLLAQKRYSCKEATLDSHVLKNYEGKYLNTSNDTVTITIKENSLLLHLKENNSLNLILTIAFLPASHDLFFIKDWEYSNEDIKFQRNKYGVVTGFSFYTWRKNKFDKISHK
jgi:predicted esterase